MAGLPGSGKTTQAKIISDKLGLCFIKTGEILREMALSGSPKGQIARKALEKGKLVDNQIVVEIIKKRVYESDCVNGFVMDGYPRSLDQIKLFDPGFDKVFYLKIAPERAKDRLLQRDRADDTPFLIKERLRIQVLLLEKVMQYYKSKGKLVEVDGEKSWSEVANEIQKQI